MKVVDSSYLRREEEEIVWGGGWMRGEGGGAKSKNRVFGLIRLLLSYFILFTEC